MALALEGKRIIAPTVTSAEIHGDEWERIWSLQCGRKKIILRIFLMGSDMIGRTDIGTIKDAKKVTGETTAIYSEARDIMQRLSTTKNLPLSYTFNTVSKKLKTWAELYGGNVFGWDYHETEEDDRVKITVEFSPNEEMHDE